MSNNNPYAAPDADLSIENTGGLSAVKQLPRFTTWGVIGLSIITLGFYAYYWLYSRTKKLNQLLPENDQVAKWKPIAALSVLLLYFLLAIAAGIVAGATGNAEASLVMGIVETVLFIAYIIFFVIWIFGFRKSLNTLSESTKGNKFYLGPILTFFLNAYYFQYKINQMHDKG